MAQRIGRGRRPRTDEEIWQECVEFTGFCWLWKWSPSGDGYGQIKGSRIRPTQQAHRWSYEYLVGPIPDGMELDHLCRVKICVNPDHLEPVTSSMNVLRGLGGFSLTGRCNSGRHDMSDPRLVYVYPNGKKRQCLPCLYETRRDR